MKNLTLKISQKCDKKFILKEEVSCERRTFLFCNVKVLRRIRGSGEEKGK
jgi:hypothetical protein